MSWSKCYFRAKHKRNSYLSTLYRVLLIFGKKKIPCKYKGFRQAADGNRTRDLRTTNATLYRLSHSSIIRFV